MAEDQDVAFAFSPAQAVQGLLDFLKSEHSKIYKSAIREVSKDPFDCEAEGLYQFLKDVQDRADKMGWSDNILNITLEVTDDIEPVQENLIDNYGTISLEQVVESELQYINEQGGRSPKEVESSEARREERSQVQGPHMVLVRQGHRRKVRKMESP
jgi:hypothetical protein